MKHKYRIMSSTSRDNLEDSVEEKLNQGWRLQGGVAVESSLDITTFNQAIRLEYE